MLVSGDAPMYGIVIASRKSFRITTPLFGKAFWASPWAEHGGLRMSEAKKLIATGRYRVYEVAENAASKTPSILPKLLRKRSARARLPRARPVPGSS